MSLLLYFQLFIINKEVDNVLRRPSCLVTHCINLLTKMTKDETIYGPLNSRLINLLEIDI